MIQPIENTSHHENITSNINMQGDKEALARLLKLAVADSHGANDTIELDTSEEILRLIPVLCAYISRDEMIQLVGAKVAAKIRQMHRMEMLQNLFLEHAFQNVLHEFNQATIPIMLFKGPVLAHTIYPNAQLRTYHDVDMLIHPEDLSRADDLLQSLGFVFYEEYTANTSNSKRSSYNYRLKNSDSWFEARIELHTAPHSGGIGIVFDVAALWKQAQPIVLLDEPALAMAPEDHLLYLCWHYRFHGFSRLLWLYDLVVLLRVEGEKLRWTEIVQEARRLQLAATLYYCLRWCQELFGAAIPAHVLAQLCPPLICRLIVESIAMPDVAKSLATEQSQTRRVIARRAMVDSIPGLLRAIIRTFFPLPITLGLRYMNGSRLPQRFVFLYYLIHPWITLMKGGRYLVMLIRRRRTPSGK